MGKEWVGIKVKFKSYYKYSFSFGNDNGYVVIVGGRSHEIYRCNIEADKEYTIQEVFDECGGSLLVILNGEELYSEP